MAGIAVPIARVVPFAAAAAALALGVVAESAAVEGDVWPDWKAALDGAVGVVIVTAGLAAWLARPDSRTGALVVAMGGLWFMGAFGYSADQAVVDYVGFPLQGWNDVLLVVLVLMVSPGGLRDRRAQVIVIGVVAAHVALALARLLLRPPNDITSCLCVPNRITGITDPGAYEVVARTASLVEAAFAAAALVLLAVRWRDATGTARRTLGALLIGAAAACALVTYNRVVVRVLGEPQQQNSDTMFVLLNAVRVAIPVAIAWSLVRGRRARTRVAELLVDLDEQGPDARSIGRTLRDPSVRLLRWSPDDQVYRDNAGRDAALPAPGDPQVATVLEREGTLLGALVHDAALREEPELLEAVAAAARLALHNERLAAEARARLEEVHASRQRIVEATDAERQRLERDLHDGAQQRLLVVNLGLQALERRAAGTGDIELADDLTALADNLRGAINEIRELVIGIRPPALTEAGLEVALEALADRMPVRVDVEVSLTRRLPDVVESTLYFAASEALANVLKYADAEHVAIVLREDEDAVALAVTDDGRGGANLGGGSGLVGLADRLDAIGGTLTVKSADGAGTEISATVRLTRSATPAGT